MTTITLKEIKAKQTELEKLIASLEEQAKRSVVLPRQDIVLGADECYAGILLDADGQPQHHLILLPGEEESIKWAAAKQWAADQGGELPSRREQALLFANLKGQFKEAWYWSAEQLASNSDYAWFQLFDDGYQGYLTTDNSLRARAVRRLVFNH